MSTRTFIPWYGGKHLMSKSLLSFIPLYGIETYVEVFGGGARVLINKPYSPLEVYNDLDQGLVAIFNCMKDVEKAKKLQRLLWQAPYAQDAFIESLEHYKDPDLDDIEKAKYKYILITQSFNSACKSWKRPTNPGVISTYKNRIINMLDFVSRFKNVTVENLDFEDLIDKYDSPTTFFYLDPPYVFETRGAIDVYEHEADNQLHIRMVDKLLETKGMALVSGYDYPLYDRIAVGDWQKIKLGDYSKSSQKTLKGGVKTKGSEFIWKNY